MFFPFILLFSKLILQQLLSSPFKMLAVNEVPEFSCLKLFEKRLCLYSLALQLKGYVLPDQDLEGLTGKLKICLWVHEG